jgi:hypothetical protein
MELVVRSFYPHKQALIKYSIQTTTPLVLLIIQNNYELATALRIRLCFCVSLCVSLCETQPARPKIGNKRESFCF